MANFSKDIPPSQEPDQNSGNSRERTIQPPSKEDMLSQPEEQVVDKPNIPKKIEKISVDDPIPDPLDMPAQKPITMAPISDKLDNINNGTSEPSNPAQTFMAKHKRLMDHSYIILAALLVILTVIGISAKLSVTEKCTITQYTDYATDEEYIECVASEIAKKVTKKDTKAFCLKTGSTGSQMGKIEGHAGWAKEGENSFVIQPDQCNAFYEWLKTDRKNLSRDQGYALHLIIHESIHVTGELNESKTECKATKIYEDVVTSFGVSESAAANWNSMFKSSINKGLSPEYHVSNWSSC